MDPYGEVAQQGQAHPLSPAYVPDPMELDEHVPVYVPEPEHPEYHAPSDDDVQVEDQPYADDASPTVESPGYIADSKSMEEDSIDYLDEPEDDDEDPEEDPEEDHTDYPADGEDGDEPSDDDYDDDEDEEPTKEEEEHIAPADSSAVPVVDAIPSAEDTKAFETDESAPTLRSPQTRIPFSQTRLRRAQKTDNAPSAEYCILTAPLPGCDVAESSAAVDRPPRGQYDFVDTIEAGQGSDIGYDFHGEVQLKGSYHSQTEFVMRNAKPYLSPRHVDRALLTRLETLETHMSRMEWQRQRAEDNAVRQLMRTHVLEARAQIDTVEDIGSRYTEKVDKYISGLPDNIHGNVMSVRPKTLDDVIELANDLMDHKLPTYAERQNENKRKPDGSSRNNQQPNKKKNVARAYTAGPGEKKAYTGNLPLCAKCNYHHTRQCGK
ncbi:hypothetical protein Tco_1210140 [Tanacetum coccineum]